MHKAMAAAKWLVVHSGINRLLILWFACGLRTINGLIWQQVPVSAWTGSISNHCVSSSSPSPHHNHSCTDHRSCLHLPPCLFVLVFKLALSLLLLVSFIHSGELPRRYNGLNTPSYARLVNHLYRLWDYDSCVESQLKIWLAKHLLQRNNLGEEAGIVERDR